MSRKWIHFMWISVVVVMLTGCGKAVEEQITEGVAATATVFEAKPMETTTTIDKIKLYLPSGYKVEKGTNEMNYIITKGKDSFILFVNTIEKEDSRLHYELLVNDSKLNIMKEQTFEQEDAFGFAAVIEHSEEQYELVVSSGGVKMTTMAKDKNIDTKLVDMMEIVRSVKVQ